MGTSRWRALRWPVAVVQLASGDAIATATAVLVARAMGLLPPGLLAPTLLALPPLVMLAFHLNGLYGRPRLTRRDFPTVAITGGWAGGVALWACVGLALALGLGRDGLQLIEPPALRWPDAMPLVATVLLGAAAMVGWRLAWRLAGPEIARPPSRRVVVVGGRRTHDRIVAHLLAQPGLEFVGVVEPACRAATALATRRGLETRHVPGAPRGASADTVRWRLEDLAELVRDHRVDTALVAASGADPATLEAVLAQARVSTLDVHVLPDRALVMPGDAYVGRLARLGGLRVVALQRRPLDARGAVVKRAEDLVIAALALLAMLPALALMALAVRLESSGPILVRQLRVGLNGRLFNQLTFRTVLQSRRDGPRLSRVGAMLRHHHLDLLPQVLNVLQGHMSIVGPLAQMPETLAAPCAGTQSTTFADRFGTGIDVGWVARPADAAARLRMKPGIIDWAQTSRRASTEPADKRARRLERDLLYIETWSLGLDLLILRKTVSCMVSADTAR